MCPEAVLESNTNAIYEGKFFFHLIRGKSPTVTNSSSHIQNFWPGSSARPPRWTLF